MSILERTCRQVTVTVYVDLQGLFVALALAIICYWSAWTFQPIEAREHSTEKWFHLAESQVHPAKRRILYEFDPEED